MFYNIRNWPMTTFLDFSYDLKKKAILSRKSRTPLILIAAFPRSACNYLSYLISETTGFPEANFKPSSGFYHDVVYLPRLFDLLFKKRIITQHLRATEMTRGIISDLRINPIILVRNIFDVVVSYNDYISKRGYGPLDPDQADLSPELCKSYPTFSDEKKYDYLIDVVVPWYISFYVSWYHYTIVLKTIDAYWLTYENFVTQPDVVLPQIFSFYGLFVSHREIESVVSQNKKVNYNKGVSGRGTAKLSSKQKDKIRSFTSYHPNVNFSMMGL